MHFSVLFCHARMSSCKTFSGMLFSSVVAAYLIAFTFSKRVPLMTQLSLGKRQNRTEPGQVRRGLLHHLDPLPGQKLSDTRVLCAGALSLRWQSRVGIPHLLPHVAHWTFRLIAHLLHVQIFGDNLADLTCLSPAHLRSPEQTADHRSATSACHARHWHQSWTLKAFHS